MVHNDDVTGSKAGDVLLGAGCPGSEVGHPEGPDPFQKRARVGDEERV